MDLGEQVDRLAVERLVGLAGLVAAAGSAVSAHVWPPVGEAGSRVVHAVLRPREREAGVEDAAGVERGGGVVDHRQRRDRGEVGGSVAATKSWLMPP